MLAVLAVLINYDRSKRGEGGKWVFLGHVKNRDGPDIRFNIRYPAKSGHFSAIRYPAGYQITEKWPDFAGYRILNRISGPSLICD